MKNYYELLGVSEKALYEEIKKAFKKKALTCHPDLFPNNPQLEELFKDLAIAYQTLENENSRASYNLSLARARSGEKQKKNTSNQTVHSTASHTAADSKNRSKGSTTAPPSGGFASKSRPHSSNSQQQAKVSPEAAAATARTSNQSNPLGYEETARSYAELFRDIFADTFGSQNIRSAPQNNSFLPVDRNGCDLKMQLNLESPQQYSVPHKKNIQYSRRTACRVCLGTGNTQREAMQPCFSCGGSGAIKIADSNFDLRRNCLACNGTGRFHPHLCKNCEGLGVEETLTSLTLDIDYSAINEKEFYKLKNKGDYSVQNKTHGDLFISFAKVGAAAAHKQFNAEEETITAYEPNKNKSNGGLKSKILNHDLLCPFSMFYVGGEMQVPTPKGPVWLKIPQGVKNGQKLRIKLTDKGQEFELYFIIQIVYPESLNEAAIQALKNFQNALTEKNFRKVGIFRS